ncbi:hypothetical protein LTS18_000191, partial [Coniosporium uncinatum]
MASRRALLRLSTRAAISTNARQFAPILRTQATHLPRATLAHSQPQIQRQQQRWHSSSGSKSKVYDFNKINEIMKAPTNDSLLIDVREPSEYAAGFIPTARNIPISSNPDALFLPPDEFEERFGFIKPPMGKEVVFYCKAGVRSSAAASMALQHGYENVAEYRGSWLDWEKQGGET